MEEKLKNVDQSLIYLENTLLAELRRLRKLESDDDYSAIEPALHEEKKDIYRGLVMELESTADSSSLSIKSFEQEWIKGRMRVVRNLLVRKLPTLFLTLSHNEHKATDDSGFGTEEHYAAPELRILDEQVAMHHVDGRTIADVAREKAQFNSRELSKGHEQERARGAIAQSPEEIAKKLAGRKSDGGASQFLAKDLSGTIAPSTQTAPEAPAKSTGIAQSPEEIRRKLAERQANQQGAGSGNKATFGARDLSGTIAPSTPVAPVKKEEPESIAQSPEDIRRKLAERQAASGQSAGRASFGAKDIEPIPEKIPQPKKETTEKNLPDLPALKRGTFLTQSPEQQ